jgi:hypothetical protein
MPQVLHSAAMTLAGSVTRIAGKVASMRTWQRGQLSSISPSLASERRFTFQLSTTAGGLGRLAMALASLLGLATLGGLLMAHSSSAAHLGLQHPSLVISRAGLLPHHLLEVELDGVGDLGPLP